MGHSWPAGGRASISGAPDSEHRPKILAKFSTIFRARGGENRPRCCHGGPQSTLWPSGRPGARIVAYWDVTCPEPNGTKWAPMRQRPLAVSKPGSL